MHEFLQQIIVEGGNIAKDFFLKGVSFKSKAHLGDLVTEADVAVNTFLINKIKERFPLHRIVSEEAPPEGTEGAEYEWIIDPIDGTRNFAFGIGMWCTMVALYERAEPYAAAIYNPLANELFFAKVGEGATLNGLPIHVNQVASLDHGFGICVRGVNTVHESRYRRFLDHLTNETTVWMHNFGTMLSSCYVASGGADFYVGNCGFDHDYAAIATIAPEAGALVTNCDGAPWKRGRRDIVITNPELHSKLLDLLK